MSERGSVIPENTNLQLFSHVKFRECACVCSAAGVFLHNIRRRALPRHNKATARPIRRKLFELALIRARDANAEKETVCLRREAAVGTIELFFDVVLTW